MMKNGIATLVLILGVLMTLAAAPEEKAAPVQAHKVVSHSLRVLLPHPTPDRQEALAYAKDLLGKLEKHFGETDGITPTQCNTGLMLRSGRWRDVIIHFTVDKELDDDAVIAKLRTYPFETTTLWSKSATTTETFEIKTP